VKQKRPICENCFGCITVRKVFGNKFSFIEAFGYSLISLSNASHFSLIRISWTASKASFERGIGLLVLENFSR
jgi:hypothetical protein